MVHSQHSTQMRCLDSESSILRSLNGPVWISDSSSSRGRPILLQPRMRLSWTSGHGLKEDSHVCCATDQTVATASLSQSTRM